MYIVNCKHFSLIFIMKTQVKQRSRKYININKKQSLIIKKKTMYTLVSLNLGRIPQD